MDIRGMWRRHKGFMAFVGLMLVFRSAVADWNYIPSSSMNPTLVAGDRVLVNKLAYNLRVPFTLINVTRWSQPAVGDVVTLESPEDGITLIKRVVATGGDTIEMRGNTLFINGVEQPRHLVSPEASIPTESGPLQVELWQEQLGGVQIESARIPAFNHLQNFAPVAVPEGFLMVMGDSRDNSRDSRFFGLVPVHSVTGQAVRVVLSHDGDKAYMPRPGRWWLRLNTNS